MFLIEIASSLVCTSYAHPMQIYSLRAWYLCTFNEIRIESNTRLEAIISDTGDHHEALQNENVGYVNIAFMSITITYETNYQ